MLTRTKETTVTFEHPFTLGAFDAAQLPATYRLVTENEEILGLSLPAYRRTATTLEIPAVSVLAGPRLSFPVGLGELESVLAADARGPTAIS